MDEQIAEAIAILQDALDRSCAEDIRTPEVFAALDFLVTDFTERTHPISTKGPT